MWSQHINVTLDRRTDGQTSESDNTGYFMYDSVTYFYFVFAFLHSW